MLVTLLHDASGQLRRLPATCFQLAQAFREWYLRPSAREQRGLKLLREWLSQEQLAQFIGSTAFVIRRSTWEQDGMLDELFPMYQVDLAYCYMLMKKGRKLYYTPSAEVIHYGSQSVNQVAKKSLRLQHQGFIDFSDHYDYFGSSAMTKRLIRWAVEIRYCIKLLELKFSKDKRVIKGPGAPKLEDAQRAAALNKSISS